MIKFMLGVAIVAFGSFCGYFLAKKYRLRRDFFKQLWEFNERFLSEISYYRRPIQEFIAVYSYHGEFNELLKDYFTDFDERAPDERILAETTKYDFLTAEEIRSVEDYFLMLGKGDSSSQNAYFSSVKSALADMKSQAEEKAKKYGDLYVKIGFLCGLFILILIV